MDCALSVLGKRVEREGEVDLNGGEIWKDGRM
jgi:hypothetical protein